MEFLKWIWKNKEWLFSGILVTLALIVLGWIKSRRENRPPAVGYRTFGPVKYSLPREILTDEFSEKRNGALDLVLFTIIVDNLSSASCRNVRILYSGDCEYDERLEFKRREVGVKYGVDRNNKEILIDEVPPNETVAVEFFNPDRWFSIEQVLIGDLEITDSMKKLAEERRYPSLYWTKLAVTAVMAITVVAVLMVTGVVWKKNRDSEVISAVTGGTGGCVPTVIYDVDENKEDVRKRFSVLMYPFDRMVLGMNKVSSLGELVEKKVVVMCEPTSE